MGTLLNEVEARVLGALVEKQITTPVYYPLTLASLTAACNQKSNRNPVLTLDEKDVARAILTLRDKHLAWETAEAGARVAKYSHNLVQHFEFSGQQTAVLCELILRGPQTGGELRTHCERMYPLGDSEQTEAILQSLMNYPDSPLVTKLPREPGRRENRFAHLLCGEPEISAEPVVVKPDAAVLQVLAENERIAALETEVQQLRSEVAELTRQFAEFKTQFE
ncbi:MAG: YceH family protein [Kiritimatiellales bacterium]